jgi:phage shock protein A
MLNQTNNEVENLEIATDKKRDDIIALMKKIGKLKEEQNAIKAKEKIEAEKQVQKIFELENSIADNSGTMERLQKVTISMYRFLLDRTLTEDREEPTFRENLDFEMIPIQKYLAWVEDIAEKICAYS